MFACNLCTNENFDCSFCNYYRIQSDTAGSNKRENPKECVLCVAEATRRCRPFDAALNSQTVFRETLLTSCDLISYVADNIPDPKVSRELELIIDQLKRVIPLLKEERIGSPTVQETNAGTSVEEGGEAQADIEEERPVKCEQGEFSDSKRGEGAFKCDLCPYSTLREDLLQKHEDSHKIGKRRFQCSTCPYTFRTRDQLRKHLLTHTGEVRFSCSACSFTTAYRHCLKQHECRHTGEKPFRCSYCNFRSASSTTVNNHERRHRDEKLYKCFSCEYRCVTSNDLKTHERGRHLDSKPFACKYCPYRTAVSGHVARHERRHWGEKPHKCSHCPYQSITKYALKLHLKRIHA